MQSLSLAPLGQDTLNQIHNPAGMTVFLSYQVNTLTNLLSMNIVERPSITAGMSKINSGTGGEY
jgi:hypothetical protein